MKVGYGKARITPPLGVATVLGIEAELVRVLDDLFVRVVCIEAGAERAIIAAGDLIGLDPEDSDDLVAAIARDTSTPPETRRRPHHPHAPDGQQPLADRGPPGALRPGRPALQSRSSAPWSLTAFAARPGPRSRACARAR